MTDSLSSELTSSSSLLSRLPEGFFVENTNLDIMVGENKWMKRTGKYLRQSIFLSEGSGIYIAPDKVREKIGIPEGKYLERINRLERMGFLKIVGGGGAKLTLEGSTALQNKSNSLN